MRINSVLADIFRRNIAPRVSRLTEATEADSTFTRGFGAGLRRQAEEVRETDRRGAEQVRSIRTDPARATALSRSNREDPNTTRPDIIAVSARATIDRRSAELGLRTPSQRALESSLFIDQPLHHAALISRQPQPELLFGEGEWAGYLDARAFARRHGDRNLSVAFMTEIHRRMSQFSTSMMGQGGQFANSRRIGVQAGRPFTDRELAAIEANPYLGYVPPGTVPLRADQAAYEYRVNTPDAIRRELQSLSDWYNNARNQPGTDPYRLAAELQQRYVSIHPFNDYNGRSSRVLMNWALEREGLPPSAPSDFNRDLFSTPDAWADEVRAGSAAYSERTFRLHSLGADADPIETFGLEFEQRVYQAQGGQTAPFEYGGHQDIRAWRQYLGEIRS
ncbi:Fic family protein [Nocardia wallacei]|uniref:Fic family protein n=1 Tax=Nocardia wallacei TaxID=480035 RepID=UPI0024554B6E|nr:Fic family protein [Nocardia wallacei]